MSETPGKYTVTPTRKPTDSAQVMAGRPAPPAESGSTPTPTQTQTPGPVKVIYASEARLRKTGGNSGTVWSRPFPSLEEAKRAPMPENAELAIIHVLRGIWLRAAAKDDWELIEA